MNVQFHYARTTALAIYLILIVVTYAALASACSATAPIRSADTAEQRMFAAYGTFVVYQELAVDMMRDPQVPDSVKLSIQRAEGRAKPVADSALGAGVEAARVRREYEAGRADRGALVAAVEGLEGWLARMMPLVDDLVAAVGDAR